MAVSQKEKTKDAKMSRYFDPTNDVAFKKLFGTEDHKPLLISFLNAILSLKGPLQIQKVEFISKDQIPVTLPRLDRILRFRKRCKEGQYQLIPLLLDLSDLAKLLLLY